jgi:hypothetical protein
MAMRALPISPVRKSFFDALNDANVAHGGIA